MKHSLIIFVFIIINITVTLAADIVVIGSVKTVSGSAFVIRQSETIPAYVGLKQTNKDILQTGKDGAMGIILRDNSILAIGTDTKIELSQFAFDSSEKKLSFVSRLIHGTLVYLTGNAKMDKDSVKFETQTAVLGVRGTKFAIKAE